MKELNQKLKHLRNIHDWNIIEVWNMYTDWLQTVGLR